MLRVLRGFCLPNFAGKGSRSRRKSKDFTAKLTKKGRKRKRRNSNLAQPSNRACSASKESLSAFIVCATIREQSKSNCGVGPYPMDKLNVVVALTTRDNDYQAEQAV